MKQLKTLAVITAIITSTISCTKDTDNSVEQTQNNSEKSVLSFTSEKEMYDKIAEVETFKKTQEQEILQKFLVRNNSSTPTLADAKNASNKELTEANKAKILEDVKFYHQEKLKAIYAERAHFGFTSIQSIVDEINFSKLINHQLYESLINNNKALIYEYNNQYHSIYGKISNILTLNHKIFISKKELDLDKFKSYNGLFNNELTNRIDMNSGIVCSGYNNFISITYRCTFEESYLTEFSGSKPKAETMVENSLSCFVYSSSGYVLYPCYFFTDSTSKANYFLNYNNTTTSIEFPSGNATYIARPARILSDVILSHLNFSVSGKVGGNFAIPINYDPNQGFLWVSGTKIF